MRTSLMIAAAVVIFSLSPALADGTSVFGGGPRYDGSVKVKDLTGSQCPAIAVTLLKGKSSSAVYRAKVKSSQIAEAMSVELPLSGALFVVAGGDGYFKGKSKPLKGNMIMNAWLTQIPKNSVASLTFTPATISEGTPSFTFSGTVTNFGFADCTAKVSGAFNLRVAP